MGFVGREQGLVLFLFAWGLVFLVFCRPLGAEVLPEGEVVSDPLALIQAYRSADFGAMRVPGFWEISEADGRIDVVEFRHPQPALLSLMMVDVDSFIDADAFWAAFQVELAASLQDFSLRERRALPTKSEAAVHYVEFSGKEEGVSRCFGLLLVHGQRRVLLLSLSSVAGRFSEFDGENFLTDVLESMQE